MIPAVVRNVTPCLFWGCQQTEGALSGTDSSCDDILLVKDNEILFSLGNQLATYSDKEKRASLMPPPQHPVESVTLMCLSPDCKFLATAVHLLPQPPQSQTQKAQVTPGPGGRSSSNSSYMPSRHQSSLNFAPLTATLLIYNLEQLTLNSRAPRFIQFTYKGKKRHGDNSEIRFTALAFSHGEASTYIACATNYISVGVLIYDRELEQLVQTIEIERAVVTQISFNPTDSSRLCTLGTRGTFQFWRFTSKSVFAAPIVGLPKGINHTYTCHVWSIDGHVVAGTSGGSLILVNGCDIQGQPQYPFGASSQQGRIETEVSFLLARDDIIIAVSPMNYICILEVKRFNASTGGQNISSMLVPLVRMRISQLSSITGIQWRLQNHVSNFEVFVASPTSIVVVNLRASDFKKVIGNEGVVQVMPSTSASSSNSLHRSQNHDPVEWLPVRIARTAQVFHQGGINCMALASRRSLFVTISSEDYSVRAWDCCQTHGCNVALETFSERTMEMPTCLDVHPMGDTVIFGSDAEIRECAIADGKFEVLRKFPTKVPFTGPNGTPFANSHPVSIVRYSNGGHLIAVVTGKVAQVFHVYNLQYPVIESPGIFTRVMVLADHSATITDLAFSKDDAHIYTSSSDGCIYSWDTYATSRNGDFMYKGISASKVVVGDQVGSNMSIVALFENEKSEKMITAAGAAVQATGSGGGRRSSNVSRNKQANSRLTKTALLHYVPGSSIQGPTTPQLLHTQTEPDIQNAVAAVHSTILSRRNTSALSSGTGPNQHVNEPLQMDFQQTAVEIVKTRQLLAFWKGNAVVNSNPQIMHLETDAISIALGSTDGPSGRVEVCIMGLVDGRFLVSMIPFPLHTVSSSVMTSCIPQQFGMPGTSSLGSNNNLAIGSGSAAISSSSSDDGYTPPNDEARDLQYLNESNCKCIQLHRSPINVVALSATGNWAFTCGAEGVIFMLSMNNKVKDVTEAGEFAGASENTFLSTEKSTLNYLRNRIDEVDSMIEDTKTDCERTLSKQADQNQATIKELETRMSREIKKRDEVIIRGREDHSKQSKRFQDDIESLHNSYRQQLSEQEVMYEKKLAQESLYIDKMRQAYDEYLLHSKMDLADFHKHMEQRENKIHGEKEMAIDEAERQKAILLKYVDYIKARNDELLGGLEVAQEEERSRLKNELAEANKIIEMTKQQGREELTSALRQVQNLKLEIVDREDQVLKLRTDLEWAHSRIQKLESALQQASLELKNRTEAYEKWEFRAGEQQQQIHELERIRKALTTQLHSLRQEIGPKEEKLIHISERLQEVDKEYEITLNAMSKKELTMVKQSSTLHLLQKQIRELRHSSSSKDGTLRRAAKLLEEYKHALKDAQFNSYKKSVVVAQTLQLPGGTNMQQNNSNISLNGDNLESSSAHAHAVTSSLKKSAQQESKLVEIMAKSEEMEVALNRLNDVLNPYTKFENAIDYDAEIEAKLAVEERERHMQQLHKNVDSLRSNIEHSNKVATTKVANHISDNALLLQEVNSMRHEIRRLSMENQQLNAKLVLVESARRRKQERATLTLQHEAKPMSPPSKSAPYSVNQSTAPLSLGMKSKSHQHLQQPQSLHQPKASSFDSSPVDEDLTFDSTLSGLDLSRPQSESERQNIAGKKIDAIMEMNNKLIMSSKAESNSAFESPKDAAQAILMHHQAKHFQKLQYNAASDPLPLKKEGGTVGNSGSILHEGRKKKQDLNFKDPMVKKIKELGTAKIHLPGI